ncbi:MAG: CbbQ/NirQ/NorQ C-terminal domain-containing protein [Proteobacteria bacterium]|nr:CbbQ/NirQ/NorQ C-terminal domain-containing protein [Pseudomonadota bacterium]
MEVGYPEPAEEIKLLADVVPTMPQAVMEKRVKVANEIRKVFVGGRNGGGELSLTLSTRGLVRWASLAATFKGAPNALAYSFKPC